MDAFFESHYEQTLLINGVQIRSIAHDIRTSILIQEGVWRICGLGYPNRRRNRPFVGDSPFGSWRTQFRLRPGAMVVRTGSSNQLEDVLNRSIVQRSNDVVPTLSTPSQDILDRYIQQRVHAKANQAHYGADLHLSTAYKTAIDNAMELKNRRHTMTFTSGSLSNQLSCAVDAIAKGVSRCASVVYTGEGERQGWDSHADNDATQSSLFEGLFSDSISHASTSSSSGRYGSVTLRKHNGGGVLGDGANGVAQCDQW